MAETTIIANLKDSGDQPLAGSIRVKLDYEITTSEGDTLIVTQPRSIPLVGGSATFSLEPSDIAKVTYLFEVLNSSGEVISSFRAFVPTVNVGETIFFADLARQTGITRDTMNSNVATVVARMIQYPSFWDRMRDALYKDAGWYSGDVVYQAGDNVTFHGDRWVCKAPSNIQGISPEDNQDYWFLLTRQGYPGAGVTGVDGPYNDAEWSSNMDAPTKASVKRALDDKYYGIMVGVQQSYAPLVEPVMYTPRRADYELNTVRDNQLVTAQWVGSLVDPLTPAVVPVGAVMMWMTSSPPPGWLICDGRAVSRTTFSRLYAIIDGMYGAGNGTTTFNLPDFRGRVAVGADSAPTAGSAGRITSNNTLGSSGGSESVTLTLNQIPSHSHRPNASGVSSFWSFVSTGGTQGFTNTTGTQWAGLSSTEAVGGGQSHTNLQPYTNVMFIIYAGV